MSEQIREAEFGPSGALGAAAAIADSPWVVMKFGGTSVSTPESWATIAALIRNRLESGLQRIGQPRVGE